MADVQFLDSIPDASLDALLSFNVLAYLSDGEESTFYKHAQRILKPKGFLIVTHSNKLFDMFSLNRYTCEFFQENFLAAHYQDKIKSLLVNALKPESRTLYNVRENPLTYKRKLKEYGFQEIVQHFINLHEAPPPLLAQDKSYPDTLSWSENDRWKLMFVCSTFGSCALRL